MISAWILYYDFQDEEYHLENRPGTSFQETDPSAWGLDPGRHEVILVLQGGSFLGAWVKGGQVK